MKNLLFTIAGILVLISTSVAQNNHIFVKAYPSVYQGSVKGINTGIEAGSGTISLNVLGQKVFHTEASKGYSRLELQPRLYHCSCQSGFFYGLSYMVYDNRENSYGALVGYKMTVKAPIAVEFFGGAQSNTSYEKDWAEFKVRARLGIGLSVGK